MQEGPRLLDRSAGRHLEKERVMDLIDWVVIAVLVVILVSVCERGMK